jgi:hypothetical protein
MKKGKEYELLIEQIYRDLQEDAEIKQDDYIYGRDSEKNRQIDLSIRYKLADADILMIVQAKDWKNKADKNVVGSFVSVIRDVRADKGILICKSGFTQNAIDYAKKERIEIYSAHAATNKNWATEILLPVIKHEDVYEFDYDILLPVTAGERINTNPETINFQKNNKLLKFRDLLDMELNKHLNQSGIRQSVKINTEGLYCFDFNNEWRKVEELTLLYRFVGRIITTNTFTPSDYRALKSYSQERIIHSYVNFDYLLPLLKDTQSWRQIKKDDAKLISKFPHIEVDSVSLGNNYRFTFKFKK